MTTPNMSSPDKMDPAAYTANGMPTAGEASGRTAALLKTDRALNKAAVRQIDVAAAKQDAVLECCQDAFEHWFARRHQSTHAMADLARAALFAENPHDVIAAWTHWSKTALERLSADAKDQVAVSAAIARAYMPAPLADAAVPAAKGADATIPAVTGQVFEPPAEARSARAADPTVTRRSDASWPGAQGKPGAAPDLH